MEWKQFGDGNQFGVHQHNEMQRGAASAPFGACTRTPHWAASLRKFCNLGLMRSPRRTHLGIQPRHLHFHCTSRKNRSCSKLTCGLTCERGLTCESGWPCESGQTCESGRTCESGHYFCGAIARGESGRGETDDESQPRQPVVQAMQPWLLGLLAVPPSVTLRQGSRLQYVALPPQLALPSLHAPRKTIKRPPKRDAMQELAKRMAADKKSLYDKSVHVTMHVPTSASPTHAFFCKAAY